MLILSLSGFGLPIYLWMYRRRIEVPKDVEERQLFSINEEDENEVDGASISSSDEEPAPYLSSMALAL